jgi:hypothetical protein
VAFQVYVALLDRQLLHGSSLKGHQLFRIKAGRSFVDALERVLAQSGQSSLAHSRAQSPSRGRKGEDKPASDSAARDEVPSIEIPRAECRKMVLGALEEVVRSVTAEHCREDVDGELGLADRERRRSLAGADNTLREGIRKWLLDVEEAW